MLSKCLRKVKQMVYWIFAKNWQKIHPKPQHTTNSFQAPPARIFSSSSSVVMMNWVEFQDWFVFICCLQICKVLFSSWKSISTHQNTYRHPLHTPRTLVSRSHFHASSLHLHLLENNSDGHIILLPMGWISSTFVLKILRICPQSWTWCCGPGCSSPPSPSSSLPAPHVVCGEQTKGGQSLLSWTNSFLLLHSILLPCSELIDWQRQMCRGMESAILTIRQSHIHVFSLTYCPTL